MELQRADTELERNMRERRRRILRTAVPWRPATRVTTLGGPFLPGPPVDTATAVLCGSLHQGLGSGGGLGGSPAPLEPHLAGRGEAELSKHLPVSQGHLLRGGLACKSKRSQGHRGLSDHLLGYCWLVCGWLFVEVLPIHLRSWFTAACRADDAL